MEDQFVILWNSARNARQGLRYDGEVARLECNGAQYTLNDGKLYVSVHLVSGMMTGFWLKEDTKPCADPRSDSLRLEHRFMAACGRRDLKTMTRLYRELGSPSLRSRRYNTFGQTGDPESPIDALFAAGQWDSKKNQQMRKAITFLQEAGSRLSKDVFINNVSQLRDFATQGLILKHLDLTDLETDLGIGFTPLSPTAVLFYEDFDFRGRPRLSEKEMRQRSKLILELLRTGMDMWPLHLPGISATHPPANLDVASPARKQVASILWPGLAPRCDNREAYYAGPALASIIEQACALRKHASWERRRVLLMSYSRSTSARWKSVGLAGTGKQHPCDSAVSGSGEGGVPHRSSGSLNIASMLVKLDGHSEALLRMVVSWV